MSRPKISFMDYVKEAFNLRVRIPAMGKVPLNWLVLIGIGTVSFFFPPFLLIGTGMELGYLYILSTNPRFQKYVMSLKNLESREMWEEKKKKILERLSSASRAKYDELEAKCRKVISIYEAAFLETGKLDISRQVIILNQILYTALRLLLSRGIMVRNIKNESRDELQKKIKKMEENLQSESSARLQKTLQSTIDIMKKRLENIKAADEKLKSIDLELMRIEEQLELLSNVAAIEGPAGTLSEKIDTIAAQINETDEWMKTDRDLFGPIEEEFEEPPEGIIDIGLKNGEKI